MTQSSAMREPSPEDAPIVGELDRVEDADVSSASASLASERSIAALAAERLRLLLQLGNDKLGDCADRMGASDQDG